MFFSVFQTKVDSAHNREVQLIDPQAAHVGNQPMAFFFTILQEVTFCIPIGIALWSNQRSMNSMRLNPTA